MDRIIVSGNSETISMADVQGIICDKGFILVFEKDTIVGYVHYNSSSKNNYVICTSDIYEDYRDLDTLIKAYPSYTFKYRT